MIQGSALHAAGSARAAMAPPIVTPKGESRMWRPFVLDNGVRAVAVHDATAAFAAAAANVRCGYFDDRGDVPGMAHMLEHAVHLGSERYPEAGGYKHYLARHGGASNASTDMVHTQYHLRVDAPALPGALSRLGAMLAAPLLDPSAVTAEARAVHAEWSRNGNSDARKLLQLRRSLGRPPYSKFSTGNAETLLDAPAAAGIDVAGALRALWARAYVAPATTLAVVGPQPPEELEALARDAFADVRAAAAVDPVTTDQQQQQANGGAAAAGAAASDAAADDRYGPLDVWGPELRGTLLRVAPARDLRTLQLVWFVPRGPAGDGPRPWRVVSHVLGHESYGSAAYVLKRRGLVQSLTAGVGEHVTISNGRGFMFWRLELQLTKAGERAVPLVLATLADALRLLRSASSDELRRLHAEAAALADLRFDWRDASEPLAAARDAAYQLHYYAPNDLLAGPARAGPHDEAGLRGFLDLLEPARAHVVWASRRWAGAAEAKERWYGAEYSLGPLPADMAAALNGGGGSSGGSSSGNGCVGMGEASEAAKKQQQEQEQEQQPEPRPEDLRLFLPEAGWGLPRDLSLRGAGAAAAAAAPAEAGAGQQQEQSNSSGAAAAAAAPDWRAPPDVVVEGRGLCCWHRLDTSWRLPLAHVKLRLVTPAAYESPAAAVAARLLVRTANDLLLPEAYTAALAGSHASIEAGEEGLAVSLEGFPDVLPGLLERALRALCGATLDQIESRFATMAGRLRQELTNWRKHNPAQHAHYAAEHLLSPGHHHAEALLGALERVKPADVAAAADAMFGRARLARLLPLQRGGGGGGGGIDVAAAAASGTAAGAGAAAAATAAASGAAAAGEAAAAESDAPPLHVDMLVYGNASKAEAAALAEAARAALDPAGLPPALWSRARALELAPPAEGSNDSSANGSGSSGSRGVCYTYAPANPNPSNGDHAIYLIHQLGPAAPDRAARLDLFVQAAARRCFHALRTEQGLGYSVSLAAAALRRTLGLAIRVQSPGHGPAALAAAADSWLSGFRAELERLPPAELADHKRALRRRYLEPPKSLRAAAARAWRPIARRDLDWARREAKAAAAEELTLGDLLETLDLRLAPGAPGRRALCSQVWGAGASPPAVEAEAAAAVTIGPGDEARFQATQPLFPAPPVVTPPLY